MLNKTQFSKPTVISGYMAGHGSANEKTHVLHYDIKNVKSMKKEET